MESKTSRQAMDENSPKPSQTVNAQAESLHLALIWLDREGGGHRAARALRELLQVTLTAVSRGDPPPEKDTLTLREILQQVDGDDATSGKPLSGAELKTWWQARVEQLRQACVGQNCPWLPSLVVKTGGGRKRPSRLMFEFEPAALGDQEEQASDSGDSVLRYRMDPAKPALWLRLAVGSRPFPMHSWRGYLLLALAGLTMLFIGLIWLSYYALWAQGQAITTAILAKAGLAIFVSVGLWWITKPIRDLPTHRVTLAGPVYLAVSELYGQLRTMRTGSDRRASREFSVVRHWGICPICSAEVDLDDGGKAFPDRLVGRCHDAPLEHVFSFDPVRLTGRGLRTDVTPAQTP